MAMIETSMLPVNFFVRAPTMDDLKAVTELLDMSDSAVQGEPDITEEDIRSLWESPNFHLGTDTWMVVAPEGRIVGYADVESNKHVQIYGFARVHPAYCGQGIGRYLLQLIEARAKQQIPQARSDARVALLNWANSVNKAAKELFEQEGYKHVRSSWHMEIEMDKVPVAAEWPAGITLRTFIAWQDDRVVFEMIDEAFSDHWGHLPMNYEGWKHWMIDREDFDPSLWFLAFDGSEIAGGSLCKYEVGMGWVNQLAVRRPWRRKGLGKALLLHSFSEFYRRGIRKVGLGVDSQNLTGATRLYERVGMQVARQYDTYEKELRQGVELSTQSIVI